MTDIADIGFRADTTDLDKAVLTLNKLNLASKGVATSTNTAARTVQGNSRAISQAALEVARATRLKTKADLDSMVASGRASKAELTQAQTALRVAKAEESAARSIVATAKANETLQRATMSATEAQTRQMNVMSRFDKTLRRGGGGGGALSRGFNQRAGRASAIANDQMPNRFNTANIAAQFQDIGVTAAMGMNPLTIALQQGTQLSAILNSMESPLAGLKQAFTSIINRTSIMAIVFTALAVVLIQFIDWTAVAKGALMGLAAVIDATAPFVLSLAAVLTLLYAPAILSGIASVTLSILTLGKTAIVAASRMAAAWVIAGGPIAWFAAAIGTVLTALFVFRDELTNLIGFDVLNMIGTGVNKIIGLFVGAFRAVKAVWKLLPAAIGSVMIETVNGVLVTVEKMVNGVVERLNKFRFVNIELQFDEQSGLANPFVEQAAETGALIGKIMGESAAENYIGAVGKAVKGATGKLRDFAGGLGLEDDEKGGKTEAERYAEVVSGAQRRIATLKAEKESLGLTREAAAALKMEQDLINQAMQKNILLTPLMREEIGQLAGTMAKLQEETRKSKEAIDFARSATKGFVDDLRSGLQEGKSLWESFANAVINVINKVLDRMLTLATHDLFPAQKGSSGGGFLASLATSLIGGAIGGGGAQASFATASARGAANPALFGPGFAKGAAFGSNGVSKFAKGGTFTNGIFSNPTPFSFANGGSFGEMGEAGPEAVMPLHRGSDGSLGVKMSGGGGSMNVTNVFDIDARGADVGVEHRIRQALNEVEQLRKDVPDMAVTSIKNANNRNLGFLT